MFSLAQTVPILQPPSSRKPPCIDSLCFNKRFCWTSWPCKRQEAS